MKYPKWFTWLEHWHGLGSDRRYSPRWWERRAYVAGLHDAAKLVELQRWQPGEQSDRKIRSAGFDDMRAAQREIHKRALDVATGTR